MIHDGLHVACPDCHREGIRAALAEMQAQQPSVEQVIEVLALALAMDGYIDLNSMDGETYIEGSASAYVQDAIEGDAASLHRWLTATIDERQAAIAEIKGRRHREGRD